MDNVTNIYGILFIATISLISGAFGLYHAWRLRANLEKEKLQKLEPALLPLDAFLVFAVLSSGALLPYFSHALRCGMFYLFLNPRHFLQNPRHFYDILFEQGFCSEAVDVRVEELVRKNDLEKEKQCPSHHQRLNCC